MWLYPFHKRYWTAVSFYRLCRRKSYWWTWYVGRLQLLRCFYFRRLMFSHSKARINLTTFQGITKVRGGRMQLAGPLACVCRASSMKKETTGFLSSSYCIHFCTYTVIEVNGIRKVACLQNTKLSSCLRTQAPGTLLTQRHAGKVPTRSCHIRQQSPIPVWEAFLCFHTVKIQWVSCTTYWC